MVGPRSGAAGSGRASRPACAPTAARTSAIHRRMVRAALIGSKFPWSTRAGAAEDGGRVHLERRPKTLQPSTIGSHDTLFVSICLACMLLPALLCTRLACSSYSSSTCVLDLDALAPSVTTLAIATTDWASDRSCRPLNCTAGFSLNRISGGIFRMCNGWPKTSGRN